MILDKTAQPLSRNRHEVIEKRSDGTYMHRRASAAEMKAYSPLANTWHSAGSTTPTGRPRR
jgi:hypothetical protein